jgi:hypothetical protein
MDPESNRLRTSYHIGFFDEVLKEADELKGSTNENVNIFRLRALLEKQPDQVVRSIPNRSTTSLLAIKQLAQYRTSSQEGKALVLETLEQWLADESMRENTTLQLVATEIYIQEDNFRAALPLVHGDRDNLDKMAMAVHIFLKLDRVDLAQRTLTQMQIVEDDDCLTVLAGAAIAVAEGDDAKLEAASLNLEELVERHGPSLVIYNALAACKMASRKFPQAFNYLKNARDAAKRMNIPTPAETLVNTTVCLQHMNTSQLSSKLKKNDLIARVTLELETSHPNHPWFTTRSEFDEMFTKCASSYSS